MCVSLNEWYHGACATCVMATRGNKCSLRQDVEGLSFSTVTEFALTWDRRFIAS